MAWRPSEQLIEGVLDNTAPNKVTGSMLFVGMKEKVVFNLQCLAKHYKSYVK